MTKMAALSSCTSNMTRSMIAGVREITTPWLGRPGGSPETCRVCVCVCVCVARGGRGGPCCRWWEIYQIYWIHLSLGFRKIGMSLYWFIFLCLIPCRSVFPYFTDCHTASLCLTNFCSRLNRLRNVFDLKL